MQHQRSFIWGMRIPQDDRYHYHTTSMSADRTEIGYVWRLSDLPLASACELLLHAGFLSIMGRNTPRETVCRSQKQLSIRRGGKTNGERQPWNLYAVIEVGVPQKLPRQDHAHGLPGYPHAAHRPGVLPPAWLCGRLRVHAAHFGANGGRYPPWHSRHALGAARPSGSDRLDLLSPQGIHRRS